VKTNWRSIDAQLGGEPCNGRLSDNEDSWEDERNEGDWMDTTIKIQVPFHKKALHPGQEEFVAGKLRHRKLVSVIREKVLRPSMHPHLHLEPYKLYWQPSEDTEPIRVHGELYTPDAFNDAHRELQESPGEPGCDLPRVVVGLMFASDGTQLTTLGNAKLCRKFGTKWAVLTQFQPSFN
jgi:hypothetical protein